jgi:stage II sporulation protein D
MIRRFQSGRPADAGPRGVALRRFCAAMLGLALFVTATALVIYCFRLRWRLPPVPPLPAAPPTVSRPERVRVVVGTDAELTVSAPGGGTLRAGREADGRVLAAGRKEWRLSPSDGVLELNGEPLHESEARLVGNKELCRVGERTYRGVLHVRARGDGRLTAANLIEPEAYLRAVVGSEVYGDWPLEALMAQAVAARTFMLHAMAEKGYLTRADMAYRGVEAEGRSFDLAVGLTRGIVLLYRGEVLPAYFHSTCGGHTASVEKVFAEPPMPPLSGVACPWCAGSPWFAWRAELTGERIAELLDDERIATVTSLAPEGTAPEGCARYVLVNGEVRVGAGALRLALAPEGVRSANFGVTPLDGRFLLEGRGYGHGAGLCQWGARGMARAGHGWQEILLHYYPGAELRKAY